MVEIMIATKNLDKIREIRNIINFPNLIFKTFLDYKDIPDVVEDEPTIEGNSQKKALVIAKHTGLYSLADDSGLFVSALGDRPGVYSARYAGDNATYMDNNIKLLKELEGKRYEERKAVFRCAMTIASSDGKFITEVGEINGYITETIRGSNGFGYDPLFYVPEQNKTFAEILPETKNKISHRAKAIFKIKPHIERIVNNGFL
ncbi:MAG: RdgB/HAM1 family non-canonical purine NTP pyrophosphatase [Elusimicrobiota bacterium]